MSNEYFIEKRRLPVDIELVTGERVHGDLFVQSSWRGPSVLEDAPEYMNQSEPFFPLQLADGSTRLVARSQVTVVRCPPGPSAADTSLYGRPATVEFQLASGTRACGTLYIEAITPNMRVLDYLNHETSAFIVLRDPAGDLVVNRALILTVIEPGHGAD